MDKRNLSFGVYDESDGPYVAYRKGVAGYTKRSRIHRGLVPKVPEKTLKALKYLLTVDGIEKVCMKKKPYKLIKTIKRF